MSCSGLDLVFDPLQNSYCLLLPVAPAHTVTLTVSCSLQLTAPLLLQLHRPSEVRLILLHNREEIHGSPRHSLTVSKTHSGQDGHLHIEGFREQDMGSYTCRAAGSNGETLAENTTLVLIHSSETPCPTPDQPLPSGHTRRPTAQLSSDGAQVIISVHLAKSSPVHPSPPLLPTPSSDPPSVTMVNGSQIKPVSFQVK